MLFGRMRHRKPMPPRVEHSQQRVEHRKLASGRTVHIIHTGDGRTREIEGFDSLEWLYNQPAYQGCNN